MEFLRNPPTVKEALVALPWVLCDDLIRGVEDLFGDLVEVYVEKRHSELEKASDFCSAKKARGEMNNWLLPLEHTAAASQPRPAG